MLGTSIDPSTAFQQHRKRYLLHALMFGAAYASLLVSTRPACGSRKTSCDVEAQFATPIDIRNSAGLECLVVGEQVRSEAHRAKAEGGGRNGRSVCWLCVIKSTSPASDIVSQSGWHQSLVASLIKSMRNNRGVSSARFRVAQRPARPCILDTRRTML